MIRNQYQLDIHGKLIVDLFAGGGGMSTGIEWALGRSPDIAINHDADALSMHQANHPHTMHYIADVFEVDPREVTEGRPVGLLHLSPDCTHHSQAAGGQPRSRKRRALAWVGLRWDGQVKPEVTTLENVHQMLKWGPLIAKRDKATGRVVTLDMVACPTTGKQVNRIAERGERVPLHRQYLVPDPKREGQTWRRFVRLLRENGNQVEWFRLVAADYEAATTRDRLYLVARRDGKPIVKPEPTAFQKPAKGQKKWAAASDCIDWSIPCPSIFNRARPLADATLRRIAKGTMRYVLQSADPFIVPIAHFSGAERVHDISEPMRTITATPKGGHLALAAPSIVPLTHQGSDRVYDAAEPLRTITGAHRGETALSAPVLVQAGYGERQGQSPRALNIEAPLGTVTAGGVKHALAAPILIQAGHGEGKAGSPRWSHGCKDPDDPLGTITASGGGQALASAFLAQANGGFNTTAGHDTRRPFSTITNTGSQQQLVSAHMVTLRQNCGAQGVDQPISTIAAAGGHHGLVAASLTARAENSAGADPRDPLQTILAGATRHGLVTYHLSPEHEAGALQVAAFLMRYYGTGGQWGDLREPIQTITTRDRLALVTVTIKGTPYVIVDIGLRMLQPSELYRGQGFPAGYIIDRGHDGRVFTKEAQVRMCGNSVSPHPARALIEANCGHLAVWTAAEKAALGLAPAKPAPRSARPVSRKAVGSNA